MDDIRIWDDKNKKDLTFNDTNDIEAMTIENFEILRKFIASVDGALLVGFCIPGSKIDTLKFYPNSEVGKEKLFHCIKALDALLLGTYSDMIRIGIRNQDGELIEVN